MNVLPLVQRLVEQGVGKMGTNLFAYMFPAGATSAVLVRNDINGTKIDYELPGYYRTRVQVIAREATYLKASALMDKTLAALTLDPGTVLEDGATRMTFNHCRPEAMPAVFPLTGGNLIEFNVYLDVCFVLETI
jgi:hypothetical protein